MNRPLIEAKILAAVDCVLRQERREDDFIEFKAILPGGHEAARRIAAQLNAARGEAVLWVEGLDEKTGEFYPRTTELAEWWPGVRKCFDDKPPEPEAMVVNIGEGRAVLGLLFEARDLPYVVRNPKFNTPEGGPVEWEVPWRGQTSTRSARRADLLRVLIPTILSPEIELVGGLGELMGRSEAEATYLRVTLLAYVVPRGNEPIVVPFMRCACSVHVEGESEDIELKIDHVQPRTVQRLDDRGAGYEQPANPRISLTRDDVSLPVPSIVRISASRTSIAGGHRILSAEALTGSATLHIVGAMRHPEIGFTLQRSIQKAPDLLRRWQQGDGRGWWSTVPSL